MDRSYASDPAREQDHLLVAVKVRDALATICDPGAELEIISGQVLITVGGRKHLVDMTGEVSDDYLAHLRRTETLHRALANVPPDRFNEIVEAVLAQDGQHAQAANVH